MLLYRYVLHYGLLLHIMSQYLCLFSLILQGLHEEGECRQLEFRLEKEQILETYSAQLQKSWNSTEVNFRICKKYWAQEVHQGATPCPRGWGARLTPLGAPPTSWAPWWPFGDHLLLYEVFRRGKNHKQPFGTRLRRHEAEPWRNQSRAPVELFCRGHFPPGGGNHHHRHHQCSSHRERAISINIFISTISSQNPSSSLVSYSCLQVWDWC